MATGEMDLPYQIEVIREIEHFKGRVLLTLDMGLGKTFCALRYLQRNPHCYPALVICPSVVKYNWAAEALRFTGVHARVCEGQKPPEQRAYYGVNLPSKLTIINFDILPYWLEHLQTLGIKTIIVDECQKFQNSKTKWTKAGKILVQGVPQLLALSGTPMLNRPYELYPMLNMLWPHHYKSSWTFSQQYCNPKWKRWGWDHSGAANLDQLNAELLSLGMVRRRKRDVLKDLPEKVWRTVPMALSNEAEYREASTNFLGWLKRTATHKVHAASKAEQLTRITYLLQLIAKLKLRSVCDWAIEFLEQSDEKLILFCVHVEAARVLRKRIPFVSVGIDISMTAKQRHLVVEQFQTDPKVRLFVGTAASGVGINLTAASEVGIVELPWRPGDLSQWVDRSHRIGQKETVFCNYLISLNTLEEKIVRILHAKQENISAVLDGGDTSDQVDMFNDLIRVLEGELF